MKTKIKDLSFSNLMTYQRISRYVTSIDGTMRNYYQQEIEDGFENSDEILREVNKVMHFFKNNKIY